MGASPAASLAASLPTAWCSSGMFILVTAEPQAAALLLKQRTGWLPGRPSGQGAKGMSLAASSPQQMLHGFQLGLGQQRTPGGGARCVKQAGFSPGRLGAGDFQRQVEVSGLCEGLSEAGLRAGPLATSGEQTRLQAVPV